MPSAACKGATNQAWRLRLGWPNGWPEAAPFSGVDICRTVLVSADRDILPGDIPDLRARFSAVAADWESGAIAWVAQRNGVPCLILRGVTDLVGTGGEAYGDLDAFVRATDAVMRRLLEGLPGWISLAMARKPGA